MGSFAMDPLIKNKYNYQNIVKKPFARILELSPKTFGGFSKLGKTVFFFQ